MFALAVYLIPGAGHPQDFVVSSAAKQTVVVRAYDEGVFSGSQVDHLGIVIGGEMVVSGNLAIESADRVGIIHPPGGGELKARVINSDAARGLALLKVPGLSLSAPPFATAPLTAGRRAHAMRIDAGTFEKSDGVLSEALESNGLFAHSATTGISGYGGPLFDECGRLIGINILDKNLKKSALARGDYSAAQIRTRGIGAVIDFAKSAGININAGTQECVSAEQRKLEAAEQARKAEEDAKEKAEAAKKAAEDAKAAAEAANKAAADEKARAARLAQEAKDLKSATDAQSKAAEEKAAKAKEAAQAAQQAADAAALRHDQAEAKAQAAADAARSAEKKADQFRRYLIISIVAGSLLVLISMLLYLLSKRRSRRELAQAHDAAHQAEQRAAAQPAPPPSFRDCLLAGDTHNIKLDGAALPEAAGGITIGRSPSQASAILPDDSVSRAHLRVLARDNCVYVIDLGSENGTLLNDVQVPSGEPTLIRSGATLQIGEVRFEFRIL